ncbi:MAG: hypothetical protein AAGK97_13285, partial [Bacteroidota bacterium]
MLELLGVSRCDASNYCVKFTTTKEGQIDLLLDFDGNDNVFTPNTSDLIITTNVESDDVGEAICIDWDGLDGLGNPISTDAGTTIPVIISFAQGIYHFPIFDAEFMFNGYTIENIRPMGSIPKLFYDDSNISIPSGTGEPMVQLAGCDLPCHTWSNFPNIGPGYGNLNTINSWWFSQQITRQDVFLLPAFLECSISGPEVICAGAEETLTVNTSSNPSGDSSIQIIGYTWTGPFGGANNTQSITINNGGVYDVIVTSVNGLGDTCTTTCNYTVEDLPSFSTSIDTLIADGETITINDIDYNEEGQFIQNLIASNGCDSILTINIVVLKTIAHYTLNQCNAVVRNGNNADYSEFIPEFPSPLSCAGIEAGHLFREMPDTNKHSCTPGVNETFAMCISSVASCDYDPGNERSAVIEITIVPNGDTLVQLSGIQFYEKSPEMYEWIGGLSGENNYPTQYGIRVLKNGTEVFRMAD